VVLMISRTSQTCDDVGDQVKRRRHMLSLIILCMRNIQQGRNPYANETESLDSGLVANGINRLWEIVAARDSVRKTRLGRYAFQ